MGGAGLHLAFRVFHLLRVELAAMSIRLLLQQRGDAAGLYDLDGGMLDLP